MHEKKNDDAQNDICSNISIGGIYFRTVCALDNIPPGENTIFECVIDPRSRSSISSVPFNAS